MKRDVLGPKISYVADLTLASGSMLKDFAMLFLGVLPGLGPYTGANRFTFGLAELGDGFEFIALVMRMFGIAEILRNLENETSRSVLSSKVTDFFPSRAGLAAMAMPILRGSGQDSILGIIPGGGAMLSSFASYALEKKFYRYHE